MIKNTKNELQIEPSETILKQIYDANSNIDNEVLQNQIQKFVKYLYENEVAERNVEFMLFGSYVNGFGTVDSDIDVSINTNSFINETQALQHWITQFQYEKNYTITQQLEYAKIPVLKLQDETKTIKFDICYNNVLGCINSKLLLAYSGLDQKVKQGGVLLKLWAKSSEIISNREFSSYTIIIMWLHFLQEKFNLPNLQDKKYKPQDMQSEISIRRIINKTEKGQIIQKDVTIKVDAFFIYNNEHYQQVKQEFQHYIKDISLIELLQEFFFYYSSKGIGFSQLFKISISRKELKPRSQKYSMLDPFDSCLDPLRKVNYFFKKEAAFDNAHQISKKANELEFLFQKHDNL